VPTSRFLLDRAGRTHPRPASDESIRPTYRRVVTVVGFRRFIHQRAVVPAPAILTVREAFVE